MLCFLAVYDERAHAIVAAPPRRYSRRWAPGWLDAMRRFCG